MGIPPGVEDALRWYHTYLKVQDDDSTPLKKQPCKSERDKYYRDFIIDLYRHSGYSIEESVTSAYAPQADELIRYLSDDKRHTLNRSTENDGIPATQFDGEYD